MSTKPKILHITHNNNKSYKIWHSPYGMYLLIVDNCSIASGIEADWDKVVYVCKNIIYSLQK